MNQGLILHSKRFISLAPNQENFIYAGNIQDYSPYVGANGHLPLPDLPLAFHHSL